MESALSRTGPVLHSQSRMRLGRQRTRLSTKLIRGLPATSPNTRPSKQLRKKFDTDGGFPARCGQDLSFLVGRCFPSNSNLRWDCFVGYTVSLRSWHNDGSVL